MQPMTSASVHTLPMPLSRGESPLREPTAAYGPQAQALDLLDCIDEAQSWAEHALGTAERIVRGLPERASVLGLRTDALRRLVAACVGDSDEDPWSLAPEEGTRLVRDLMAVGEALATVRSRSRAASKHVMRLALQAPAMARRAKASVCDDDPVSAAATLAWLDGLPERAKDLAERSRSRLGGLPLRADALHARVERIVSARPRRRRSRVPTDRFPVVR